MDKLTFRLVHDQARYNARRAIEEAPDDYVVTVSEPRRTNAQNDLMWALIDDVMKAKPEGREMDKESWKAMFMHLAGFKPIIQSALDGEGIVIVGYKSSRLTKAEMGKVIDAIYYYAGTRGVELHDHYRDAA